MRLGLDHTLNTQLRHNAISAVEFFFSTPTLTLLTSSESVKPQFQLLTDAQATKDDVLRLRYSTDPAFGTFTDLTMTLTALTASHGDVLSGITSQSDGTYYFKVKHERGAQVSDWSSSATVVIAAASVPSSATYTKFADQTPVILPGFTNSAVPFDSIDIGGKLHADRMLSIGWYAQLSSLTGSAIYVDFLDGNGPQLGIKSAGVSALVSNRGGELWQIAAPIGSIIDVIVFGGNFGNCQIAGGVAHGLASQTPTATQFANMASPADDYVLPSLTIPTPGIAIAMIGFVGFVFANTTWKAGYTKQGKCRTTNADGIECGSSTTPGASVVTVTRNSFQTTCGCVAAYTGV